MITRGRPADTVSFEIRRFMSGWAEAFSERMLPAAFLHRLREERDWRHWISRLELQAFEDLGDAPAEIKRRLFKHNVTLVEIEVHAKCNRVCSFCPNAIVDRRRNGSVTDEEMLDRLFDDLGSIDYSGQIKIARYSEPLTNLPYLLDRIAAARKKVPRALLAIVTNTDYLKPPVLSLLGEAGLDRVYMSIYLKANERWSLPLAHEYSDRLAAKLGCSVTWRQETPVSLRCRYEYDGLDLHSACIDFSGFGTDRGQLMEQYTSASRVGPCREPFETFVVDYTGKVVPCCNLRSDFPEHQDYIVGDLSRRDVSVFDIYAGRLAAWRRSMASFDRKDIPCTTCTHRDLSSASATRVTIQLQRRLSRIGRPTTSA